jgi:uncharacterized protein
MVAMWVPGTVALGSKVVPAAVLGTAGLRFGVTAIYELTGSSNWRDAAGIVGLVLCGLAIFAALAMALEDGRGSDLQPEPGVREQL